MTCTKFDTLYRRRPERDAVVKETPTTDNTIPTMYEQLKSLSVELRRLAAACDVVVLSQQQSQRTSTRGLTKELQALYYNNDDVPKADANPITLCGNCLCGNTAEFKMIDGRYLCHGCFNYNRNDI